VSYSLTVSTAITDVRAREGIEPAIIRIPAASLVVDGAIRVMLVRALE